MKHRLCQFLLALLLIFLSPLRAWETFHGDSSLTGRGDCAGRGTWQLAWRASTGAPVSFTCLIDDRQVYAFDDRGTITVLDHRGTLVWKKTLSASARLANTGVLTHNGLAAASSGGDIFLFGKADGNLLWKKSLALNVVAPLNKGRWDGRDHVLVLDQTNGVLHALRADTGTTVWKSTDIGRSDCPPASNARAAVFGSCLAKVHLVDLQTGRETDAVELDSESQVAAGAALDGDTAFVGSRSGRLMAIDLVKRQPVWQAATGDDALFTTPAVAEKWVVVGNENGELISLDRTDGATAWRRKIVRSPSSPAVSGTSVFTTDAGRFYVLDLATGTVLENWPVSDAVSPVAVGANLVVIGTDEGDIVAFSPQVGKD